MRRAWLILLALVAPVRAMLLQAVVDFLRANNAPE
jgi:hypothetical protein